MEYRALRGHATLGERGLTTARAACLYDEKIVPEGGLFGTRRDWERLEGKSMNQSDIFAPFVGTMLLTLVVWVYMYAQRLPFIMKGKLTPQQLTAVELARLSPPKVANPSDNLKNLFELPTIFYAVVLYLYATMQVDAVYLAAAWFFFAFRIVHSAVHCTFNLVPLRFWLYAISALALWFMVLRIAWRMLV